MVVMVEGSGQHRKRKRIRKKNINKINKSNTSSYHDHLLYNGTGTFGRLLTKRVDDLNLTLSEHDVKNILKSKKSRIILNASLVS